MRAHRSALASGVVLVPLGTYTPAAMRRGAPATAAGIVIVDGLPVQVTVDAAGEVVAAINAPVAMGSAP
jgi:multidrug efflux pump subunit AcrA (membrane-fusion protein)